MAPQRARRSAMGGVANLRWPSHARGRTVRPGPRAFDRQRPALQAGCRLVATHARLEAALDLPVARDLIERCPETHAEAREISGTESRGFGDARTHDRHAEH